MQKNPIIFATLSLLLSSLFINSSVFAGDIEWSGLYRVEGNQIINSEMRGSQTRQINYALSTLILRPKFVASDGLIINAQLDLFKSSLYPNTQFGQIWGDGVGTSAPDSMANSNSISQNQNAGAVLVSELYMTYSQEFGQLLVGRAPLQFGLGITHNAGRGLFDHFHETRDMVAYKIIMGNMYILPMIGKPSSGNIAQSSSLNDYMVQVEYDNPDTDISMGVFYQWRKGGDQATDAPIGVGTGAGQVVGGPGATNGASVCNPLSPFNCHSPIETKTLSVYMLRDTPLFRIGLEAAFQSGDSGVVDASGDKVGWSGFGLAGEFEYRPEASSWKWGLKAGLASGDDPATAAKYEGYAFNRNYDVAMLLFNHPLGRGDFLRSAIVTGDVHDASGKNIDKVDVEAISNVVYVAPVAKYAFNDHWSMDNSIITGWLSTNPLTGQKSKEIGYEWDLSINYAPRKGIMWTTQMGLLFPGAAWNGDDSTTAGEPNYTNNAAYGFGTKAAISF